MNRIATVEKEWTTVYRKGSWSVEDWYWTVSFDYGPWYYELSDQHYIHNEADAKMIAALFEDGVYTTGELGELCFDTAFT